VPKLESAVLGLESEVMISKSGPDIFCKVALHGAVDRRTIPGWLYIELKGPFKKRGPRLKKRGYF